MSTHLVFEIIAVCLYSGSLIGWGFLWGFEFGTGQIPVRLWCLRAAHAVVKPLATVTGAVFWRLEKVRARLQTAVANEEASR